MGFSRCIFILILVLLIADRAYRRGILEGARPVTKLPPTGAGKISSRVVGVFPVLSPPLDFAREIEMLRGAGGPWELYLVEGTQATRGGIVAALREGGARILYVASHGNDDGIYLSGPDKIDREWLPRIVRAFNLEGVVLNACRTRGLATACVNAGAQFVIVTDKDIEDESAGIVGALFMESLASSSLTAGEALALALASVDDETARRVRLLGNASWSWET